MEESAMVLESARRHLAGLAPLAKRLNEATDAFTEELKTIEIELAGLGLGLDVTLSQPLVFGDLEEEQDDEGERPPNRSRLNKYLGYGRDARNPGTVQSRMWGLLVRTYRDYEDPNIDSVLEDECALLSASRQLRAAAAEHIEALLRLITAEAKEKVEFLEKATDQGVVPEGWETLHHGLDQRGVKHGLEFGTDEGLCGVKDIITTNFEGDRPICPKCLTIARRILAERSGR